MDAKGKLAEFKAKLDAELKVYLNKKTEEAGKISPHLKELQEHIYDFTLRGGKRIRAALMYYSYLAHGGQDREEALKASMGMEMSETFLLIHDDIIDNDSLRRGGITTHVDYEQIATKRYPGKIDPKLYGISFGILAGDIAAGLSNDIIANSNFKPEYRIRAIDELNKTYVREIYGEALDILSEIEENITQKDIILVQQLKTAPYTFDTPMKLGAMLAGASEDKCKALEKYTIPMGTAFQIQDDIIGMFGSEEKTGKSVTSDLREGKRTLLILDALDVASERQKEIINRNLGNKNIAIEDLEDVKKVIVDTGALEKSKDLAKKYVNEAYKALSELELEKEGKDFLLGIADYMINREY